MNEFYITRDQNGDLFFWSRKPIRSATMWKLENSYGDAFKCIINPKLFQEQTWNDEPKVVKLIET